MLISAGHTEFAGPSLLVIEAAATLLGILVAFCWPRAGSVWFSKIERVFGRLAKRRVMSVVTVGLAALFVRLSILPVTPIPQPFIHDEFSYLLAGDTFASGRLTNPTHSMWKYFETFHVNQQPTYMSMYFPAQGLVLAAGKVLMRHPWFGVWLSSGIMCSAICWTLQGWLPPSWALLGGMLAVMRLGLFTYWVNGYNGGAVAAIGGAFVLGVLPRLKRTGQVRDFLLLALGIAILANSRPVEGLLVCVPALLAVFWWVATKGRTAAPTLIRRSLPGVALLVVVAASMAYYNHRVFGNSFTLPYQTNRAMYATAPVFLWLSPRAEPAYRYKVMRDFYTQAELGDFQYARTLRGFFSRTGQKIGVVTFFIFGVALMPPLLMLPWLLRDRRMTFLIAAGTVFGLGVSVNAWLFPHYVAPFAAGLYVILLQTMRHLRAWRPGGHPSGLFVVRTIPVICLMLVAVRVCAEPLNLTMNRWPAMWYGTKPLGLARARVLAQIENYPGRQLAIVRYAPEHQPFDDWVYNAADIDNSRAVWAREMDTGSAAPELLQYFRNRRVWLVQPDANPPMVSPYRMQDPGPMPHTTSSTR